MQGEGSRQRADQQQEQISLSYLQCRALCRPHSISRIAKHRARAADEASSC